MNIRHFVFKSISFPKLKWTVIYLGLIFIQIEIIGQVNFETNIEEAGKEISKELIGAFFEDINYAADGGLYAELIQNRSFEYFKVPRYVNLEPLHAWSLLKKDGAKASISVESSKPLNKNNRNYLKLVVSKAGLAGIINNGWDGIHIKRDNSYNYSVYIRSDKKLKSPVYISITNEKGMLIGADTIQNFTSEWKKFSGVIKCTESTDQASLTIATNDKGTLYFDMVSLFPESTFKNRENGLRVDLAEAIEGLHPKFLRFPGGCISHGRGLDNAYRWKETIGRVEERKPNWNLWGYHQTYGLGFYEYFLFCEDIGAIPLPVVPVGISCQFRDREIVPLDQMQSWIDDALDLVEFANGDSTTTWGSKRAKMGHPEPFNMKHICLGNEEDDIPEFRERFKMIADALKAQYPEIKIIGTSGTAASGGNYNSLWEYSKQEQLDAVDEHYYVDPTWLLANNHRYDDFDRKGPKVFLGEYASRDDKVANAIAEAAYLTGIERNGDIVEFSCYAPLLANENHHQWNPDLIRFDNKGVSKTVNYYVQQLFSLYSGNKYISSNVSFHEGFDPYGNIFNGKIGVGTWGTKAAFDSIKIISGDSIVFSECFSQTPKNWEVLQGTFSVKEGEYMQTSFEQPAWSILNKIINEEEYIIIVKARKMNGPEGFLVPFAFNSSEDYYWLNLGGWNNTMHAIEKGGEHGKSTLISFPGSVKKDKWYKIQIEVSKSVAKIFLNGKFLFEVSAPAEPVAASVVKNDDTNELIIKMVNSSNRDIDVSMNLKGGVIDQNAKVITFTGEPIQKNSLETPDLIKPSEEFYRVNNQFSYTLPANTLKVFVLKSNN